MWVITWAKGWKKCSDSGPTAQIVWKKSRRLSVFTVIGHHWSEVVNYDRSHQLPTLYSWYPFPGASTCTHTFPQVIDTAKHPKSQRGISEPASFCFWLNFAPCHVYWVFSAFLPRLLCSPISVFMFGIRSSSHTSGKRCYKVTSCFTLKVSFLTHLVFVLLLPFFPSDLISVTSLISHVLFTYPFLILQ